MKIWTLIGFMAAACGAISLIPEVIKAYRTHHLQDVSWAMLMLLIGSSTLWGAYGIHMNDIPLVVSAGFNFTMEIALIVMKRQYDMTGRPMKEQLENKPAEPALETEPVSPKND